MKLSVVIPCYNEIETIDEILTKVRAVDIPLEFEIVIVDDGSNDGTRDYLNAIEDEHVKIYFHEENQGKGGALHTAFAKATGDLIVIQDADLEYDPADYPRLLQPILDGKADVVYGSRFVSGSTHRVLYFWHSLGNRLLTLTSNMFTNLNLTDMEVGYKLFKKSVLDRVHLSEKRFGFEPEVTAKIARLDIAIYEVGISYYGRTYADGKKINWRDGVRALYVILKYGLFGRFVA